MSKRSNIGTWLWVIGIGLILYIVNAAMLIYFQVMYYQNPSALGSLISILPFTQEYELVLQDGLFGVLGTMSIILVFIMIYLLTGIAINNRVSASTKIALIVLALIQLFIGNAGLLIGLILVLVSSIVMR
ncbi:MAG: hypothetical protein TU36_000340 [Vulcanisaeta sp. AZ3]